jgi:hypothetical protein
LLESCTGQIWDFLPFCISPIIDRIRSDADIASALFERIQVTDRGAEKASLPRLLALANPMSEELHQWCENEFARQSDRAAPPEFGLDVITGSVRPVAHAILDALSPNQ